MNKYNPLHAPDPEEWLSLGGCPRTATSKKLAQYTVVGNKKNTIYCVTTQSHVSYRTVSIQTPSAICDNFGLA